MEVVVVYSSAATVHTTTSNMQRVLTNTDISVVNTLVSAMMPRCKAAQTQVEGTLYIVRV